MQIVQLYSCCIFNRNRCSLNGIGVMYGKITSFIMTLAMKVLGLNYVLTHGHAYYLQIPTYTWMGTLNLFYILSQLGFMF